MKTLVRFDPIKVKTGTPVWDALEKSVHPMERGSKMWARTMHGSSKLRGPRKLSSEWTDLKSLIRANKSYFRRFG